jgi:hypothetical protein
MAAGVCDVVSSFKSPLLLGLQIILKIISAHTERTPYNLLIL